MTTHDKLTVVISVAVLAAFLFLTVKRNEVWRSAQTLWADAVSKSPNSPRANINLGNEHQKNGNLHKAMEHYQRAADVAAARLNENPKDFTNRDMLVTALVNMAGVMIKGGDAHMGEMALEGALSLMPHFGPAVVMLTDQWLKQRKYAESITLIEGAIQAGYGAGFTQRGHLYFNYAAALCELGFEEPANVRFRHAALVDPDFADSEKRPRYQCGETSPVHE